MRDGSSLYARTAAKYEIECTADDYLRLIGPETLREWAVVTLRKQGISLIGDTTLIEHVIGQMELEIIEAIQVWFNPPQLTQRGGRPENATHHNAILYAASLECSSAGMSLTQARRAAARRLGGSISKDKVEKAERAYRRQMAVALRTMERSDAVQLAARLLMTFQSILSETEREMRAEAADRKQRRYIAR